MNMAKLANAGLAALGGFEETIKPGCQVQVGVLFKLSPSKGAVIGLAHLCVSISLSIRPNFLLLYISIKYGPGMMSVFLIC